MQSKNAKSYQFQLQKFYAILTASLNCQVAQLFKWMETGAQTQLIFVHIHDPLDSVDL